MGYTASRGFTVGEVEDAIRTCAWGRAELGRLDCRKNFPYGAGMERESLCDQAGSSRIRGGSRQNSCDNGLYVLFLNHENQV